ncbi:MAG: Gfo/Idh/MocA family oxidoreductase [Deferribacteres bacterium]|nr:Gfo/Idh/MocA family oxidoreductase [candidate division KSB1 bacterium]MCB9501619.1 Gfo/Idh/MocA family oxidoreductase [Deferribacteres bacterium]
MKHQPINRRKFIKRALSSTTVAFAAPTIVSSYVFGKNKPGDTITIAQIGCGRIARGHDMPETLNYAEARIVACCDPDSKRAGEGKQFVENWYAEKRGKKNYVDVKTYTNYQEMLQDKSIDAVIISTPDHWHAQIAIEAALAGKDIYLQKPASLTIEEGRLMSDIVHRTGRIFQIGSQQRSANPWPQFKRACELVRNGRIGELQTVYVGLPGDPGGEEELEMPIPANLNYDMWLGSTPNVYYTEKRVHPQDGYSRPGWLRCEQFGAGMITGWGAHHIDTAHWGMDMEYSGPVEVEAEAEFPKHGLWNVHGKFKATAKYENGVTMHLSGDYPNGVKFVGTDGWIFVSRGAQKVTASDPGSPEETLEALVASDPKILESPIGENEIHLYHSEEQHGNWLDSIKTRKQPIANAEIAHRSCSACLVNHIAMKLPRKLHWDPVKERFKNDDEANAMLSRPGRFPYGSRFVLDGFKW